MLRVVHKWRWFIQPENVRKNELFKYFDSNFADIYEILCLFPHIFLYILQNGLRNIVQGLKINHGAPAVCIAKVTIARHIYL